MFGMRTSPALVSPNASRLKLAKVKKQTNYATDWALKMSKLNKLDSQEQILKRDGNYSLERLHG